VSAASKTPEPATLSREERIAAESTTCEATGCGGALTFDPAIVGSTCGGNVLAGWLVCDRCGGIFLTLRATPIASWRVTSSGRAIDVGGGCRLRADGGGAAVPAVMSRIARLPDLERALRAIASGAGDAVALARAALEVG
jgi:hypothetical protein